MKKFGLACAGVLALMGWAAKAEAAPAAWCHGTSYTDQDDHAQDLASNDPMQVLVALARTACSTNPAVEAQRAQIEQARAAWGKKYGLVDADWLDVIAYDDANAMRPTPGQIKLSTKDINAYSPLDQFAAIWNGFSDGYHEPLADSYYAADVLDAHLTQTGRLAFLMTSCIPTNTIDTPHSWASNWAICEADLDAFDVQKLYDELRGDTAHTPPERMAVRFAAHDAMAKLKDIRDKEQALFKEDPEYKRVFDVAAKAREAWQKTVGADPELLALAHDMDAAMVSHSRKALAGCEARTAAALEKAVATIPAKAFAHMYDARDNPFAGFGSKAAGVLVNAPVVYVAGGAYIECQPKSGYAGYLGGALSGMPGFRGPRTAAQHALIREVFTFDDTSKPKLPIPSAGARPFAVSGNPVGTASCGGTVKSLKPKGDHVEVILAPTLIKQQDCVKEHTGRHIDHIDSSGTVHYEIICDKWAMVTHDDSWSNFTITKAAAKRLRPGELFSANYGTPDADVIAVWPNTHAKQPSMVLGARLK